MKKLLLIWVCLSGVSAFAQQHSLNTNYMFNPAFYNPAAAGLYDYMPIHFNFRSQWVGFDGAPTTQLLTTHANVGSNLGLGGSLFNESSGPSRFSGGNIMLSYNLRLSSDDLHHLRGGLGISIGQHVIDVSEMTMEDDTDPTLTSGYNNQFVPDADVGFYYTYSNKGYAGISLRNAAQMKKDLFNFSQSLVNNLRRHYYFIGGYNFTLHEDWNLNTSTLLRFIEAKPFQFDVNVMAEFRKYLWFGFGYRHLDAVTCNIAFQYGIVKAGYAYDFGISDIRKYSTGTQEIFLEVQLSPKKGGSSSPKTPWTKRNRVYKQPRY